jgi:hypothetical protein
MKKPKLLEGVRMRKDLDGYLLYYPRNHMYLINEVGYDILSNCNGKNTIENISNFLLDKYSIDKKKAEDDIDSFLKKFESLIKYD